MERKDWDMFSFYTSKEYNERRKIINERDEWKRKYEELKSHVDFMRGLMAPDIREGEE